MVGTAVKILIGVAIGIAVILGIVAALLAAAVNIFEDVVVDLDEQARERDRVAALLGSYQESAAFVDLYPEYMEELISIIPGVYQYELRSIDEDGSVFETDSLIIEYDAGTDQSTITYLCTESDGDRVTYDEDDLAEVMADVCG